MLIVVKVGSVAMEDHNKANTRRYLGIKLGNTITLNNELFHVLEYVRTMCARTC